MIPLNNDQKIIYQKIIKINLLFFVFLFSFVLLLSIQWVFDVSGKFIYEYAKASFYDGTVGHTKDALLERKNLNQSAKALLSVAINESNQGNEELLFSQNENKILPVASLVKLMTALVVLENYNLSEEVTISNQAMEIEGEQGNLKEGEVLSVENLLYIMLVESSNRAAYALAETMGNDAFVEVMNKTSQKMKLENTHFEDSTGLLEASYSTASDIKRLSETLFFQYPLFREIISLKEFDLYLKNGTFHHKLVSTNQLLGDQGIVGGKTGYTNAALGCLIEFQQKNGGHVIHVILGAEDRFLEAKKLINWTNLYYQQ